jgi:hypothetical protein
MPLTLKNKEFHFRISEYIKVSTFENYLCMRVHNLYILDTPKYLPNVRRERCALFSNFGLGDA